MTRKCGEGSSLSAGEGGNAVLFWKLCLPEPGCPDVWRIRRAELFLFRRGDGFFSPLFSDDFLPRGRLSAASRPGTAILRRMSPPCSYATCRPRSRLSAVLFCRKSGRGREKNLSKALLRAKSGILGPCPAPADRLTVPPRGEKSTAFGGNFPRLDAAGTCPVDQAQGHVLFQPQILFRRPLPEESVRFVLHLADGRPRSPVSD